MIDWLTDYERYRKMHALGFTSFLMQQNQTRNELEKTNFKLGVIAEKYFTCGFIFGNCIQVAE